MHGVRLTYFSFPSNLLSCPVMRRVPTSRAPRSEVPLASAAQKTPATIQKQAPDRPVGWVDYSHELKLSDNPLVRLLFAGLGLLCVGSAILGVFLPGWPTTIWLIIATFFFARSSPRFYNMVLNHRIFGPLIRDYRAGLGIPRGAKILAISMITVFAGSSVVFLIETLWVRLLVTAIGLAGVGYLLWLPTRRAEPGPGGRASP